MADFTKLIDESFTSPAKVDISWKNLTCTLKTKFETREILKNVSGHVRHGEFLVIMGSSGAGKSTLLNILSNRLVNTSKTSITGQILVNSSLPSSSFFSQHIGYVTQEDNLIESMTVFECLLFAARMKTNHPDKKLKVLKMIELLKLENCKNTYIGGPYLKGISGGEKKRTSIGIELITDPSVLFLDEPTSGLDSYTALVLMKILNTQALEGKTVISTIHQPSSDIFHLFDKLMLLSDGQVAYHGPAKNSVGFFAKAGFECPRFTNPADYFMEVLYVKNSRELTNDEKNTSSKLVELQKLNYTSGDFISDSIQGTHLVTAGFFIQLFLLFARSMQRVRRNFMIGGMRIIVVFSIAGMQLIFYWDMGTKEIKAQTNRTGFLFFTMACMTFCNILSCVLAFPSMKNIMTKEYQSNTYGIIPYFIAQNLNDLIFDLIMTVGYCSIIYWAVGLNDSGADVVIKFYLIVFLCLYLGGSMGMLCGCSTDKFELALASTSGVLFPFMYFAGFYRSGTLPDSFKWAKYCSPFYYLFQAMMKNQYSTMTIKDCYPPGFKSSGTDCTPLDDFDVKLSESTSILIVSMISVGVRLASLALMKFSVRKSKLSN
jgi:ABC-type multidrug transport system ATPase subunit/ABC-type multidrug transport system permease subunit